MPEQPMPKEHGQIVYPQAQHDFEEMLKVRVQEGYRRYGSFLRTDNGRDGFRDLREEIFDAWMYATQVMLEHQDLLELLKDVLDSYVWRGELVVGGIKCNWCNVVLIDDSDQEQSHKPNCLYNKIYVAIQQPDEHQA